MYGTMNSTPFWLITTSQIQWMIHPCSFLNIMDIFYIYWYMWMTLSSPVMMSMQSTSLLNLAKWFSLKDLGSLTYFLSVEIQSHPYRLVLSQHGYIQDLLHRTNMSNSRPVATLLPPGPPPTLTMGELLLDPSEYRATVGSL